MDTVDSIDRKQIEISSNDSYPPFIPVTPNTSEAASFKTLGRFQNMHMSTKSMLQQTIKSLSAESRFSFDRVRKIILHNYFCTANAVKHRLPTMKKFFRSALEIGDLINVKGVGLTGSFRVPRTSPLHKNFQKNTRKIKNAKKTFKKQKIQKGPVAKPKKVKAPHSKISANM